MIEQIGKHRIQHGNLMDGIDELMQGQQAQIFYSDPPWGQGNLTYWQTMNTKMNGVPPVDIELGAFLDEVFNQAVKYSKQWVLIEYGQKWADKVQEMGTSRGLKWHGKIELLYRSGSKLLPLDLHIFSKNGGELPADYADSLYHTHGFETLKRAIGPLAKQGEIIVDPACGMGYTAMAADMFGMAFRGNEINEKRLGKCRDFLYKTQR